MLTHDCSNASPDQGRREFMKRSMSFAILASPVTGAGICVPDSVEERATRLAWELADLLNDYGDGTSYAVVHPSRREEFAVAIMKALPA